MKSVNPWKLVALFGGLLIVFAAVKIFRSPKLEGNLPGRLTEIDSAAVTDVIIMSPKAGGERIQLVKSEGWKLKRGDQLMRLEQGAGTNAVRMLIGLKPERMVSKRKEKWDEFGVGDSTATRVQLMVGSATGADLWIGRSGFSQVPGQQYGGSTFTYVRLAGDNEVYAVEGFLEGQFNRKADDWRDKSFLRLKRDSVDRIRFRYAADSSFVLEKRQGEWMVDDQPADSSAVVSYLIGMEYKNVPNFAKTSPVGNSAMVVTFEKQGRTTATIEAWPVEPGWIMRSSHQSDAFFEADAATRRDVLAGRKKFLSKSQ